MHSPYALDFTTCFFAAQACAALMLTALLLFWRFAGWVVRATVGAAIWLAVVAPAVPGFLSSLGMTPGPHQYRILLAASAGLTALSAVLARRPIIGLVLITLQVPLWLLTGYVTESEFELAGLHLALSGLVLGLLVHPAAARGSLGRRSSTGRSHWVGDIALFAGATVAGALASRFLLHHGQGSADEWAYTFQAAVFAKGHVYATSPRCQPVLQSFYVFEKEGRLFSQYTPGWPLFLAPFFAIHLLWLAAPVSHGLLAVGVARVTRSTMRLCAHGGESASEGEVRAAGWWAAVLATTGGTVLLNAGSYYPHAFSVALLAWMLEAMLVTATPELPAARQWRWGALLGITAAAILGTRVAEGALLGLGVAVYYLYALLRRRVGWRAFVGTSVAFAVSGLLLLVILRLQIGTWFTTGYALSVVQRGDYFGAKYAMPTAGEWKWGFPVAAISYCFCPASLPLGLAGLATLRGRALGLVVATGIGCAAYLVFCEWLTFGRGFTWGYGPRYFMPLLVPIAVGGGAALAPLTMASRRIRGGGPLVLAVFAALSGWMRVVPLLWPTASVEAKRHSALVRAIDGAHLTNAIVLAQPGTTGNDPLDLPTNLPIDLYPDQPVIIAIDKQEAAACLRNAYPGRRLYRASGYTEVDLVPQ
jgi:hypothetical protein